VTALTATGPIGYPASAGLETAEGRPRGMDIEELQRLVRLMNESGLVELEIESEGQTVRLRKASAPNGVVGAAPAGPLPAAAASPPAAGPGAPAAPSGPPPGVQEIRSPIVGTFYRSSSPEAGPYVNVGDRVTPDTVVCIIEAMKVMNEIKAEVRGEVLEALVENGDAVEFDQPLFRVKVEK
jgi:acetyl-CoA carboxylase biotin carboxyl carrier protein